MRTLDGDPQSNQFSFKGHPIHPLATSRNCPNNHALQSYDTQRKGIKTNSLEKRQLKNNLDILARRSQAMMALCN